MSSPEVRLEEQLTDERSNQIAYKISISSPRESSFRLISLEPRTPAGSRLVEVIDTSVAEINTRRKDLIDGLNSIVRNVIWVKSETFREEWITVQRSSLGQVMSFSGIFRLYSELFLPFLFSKNSIRKRFEREFRKMNYQVSSVDDAMNANDLWIEPLPEDDYIRKLFGAKIVQLQHIEQKVGRVEDTGLADIDSSSPFTATYVIHFKRGLLEPRKYQIGFDVEYMDTDAPSRSTKSASASSVVEISPSPIALSFVTVIAAVFGTTVKILLASNQSQNSAAALSIASVPQMLNSPQMLVGPIVALIFFNIYEKTSLAKGMSLSVNWRSALLIGALCGLAYERILEALKALIGA